ncbi:MAG: site-specific DNA-methyltransferase [Clostridia bacterium]|nr:site-specific DNA-methyltransferase [Clostridia bacterium]
MFRQTAIRHLVFGSGADSVICADAAACPALEPLRGRVQAVYIDPPFMTGDEPEGRRPFGEEGWRLGKPTVAMPGYSDRFPSREAYLAFLRALTEQARGLLTDSGLFMLHLDWRVSAHARLLLDEIFGGRCFVNEVIWAYESGGRSRRTFSRKHDTILIYGRTPDWRLEPLRAGVPRSSRRPSHMRRGEDADGRAYRAMVSGGREYRYYDDDLITPGDVWTDVSHLQQRDPERTGWPTQKPLKLVRRLLACAVREGETAVDLCGGSGTAAAAARGIGARFVTVDAAPAACVTAALRLGLKDLTLDLPAEEAPAVLEGTLDPAGMMLLTAFDAADPAFPAGGPLDGLTAWAAGRIRGDVFEAQDTLIRTPRTPALTPMALLRPGEGTPAVAAIDAVNRLRVYAWEEA